MAEKHDHGRGEEGLPGGGGTRAAEAGPHVAAPWGPRTSQFHRDLRMKRQVRPGCERSAELG